MIYISEKGQFNFEDHFTVKLFDKEEIPSQRISKQSVIGRDGQFTFNDGLNDIKLTLGLEHYNDSIQARVSDIRDMKNIILHPGFFVSSTENDVIYTCNIETSTTNSIDGVRDSFSVTITCKPIATSRLTPEMTAWIDIDIPWDLLDIPWLLIGTGYEFSASDETIEVTNYGNRESLPIIKLNAASGNVTLSTGGNSFTYTGLEDSIYVDCNNLIVYNTAKTNKIANFTGDFISLIVGANDIIVTGTTEIEFINRDSYV
jgi:phage-related protein